MRACMAGCGPAIIMCNTTGAALRMTDCRTSPTIMRVGASSVFNLTSAAVGDCFAAPAAVHGMVLAVQERVKVRQLVDLLLPPLCMVRGAVYI